jgi:hypothetical protein
MLLDAESSGWLIKRGSFTFSAKNGVAGYLLATGMIYNDHPSYRVGQASELTKKARSPAQHISL